MKSLSYCLVLIVALVGLWIAGCSQPPGRITAKADKTKPKSDPWKLARDTFHQSENVRAGDEWTRFRGGCDQLKSHFAKAEVAKRIGEISDKNRPFLEKEVHLSPDELAEVESTTFRTPDAHYLDECFLLREAAKALEIPAFGTADRARLHFEWVMRNILPHEQTNSWTPPAFTLRHGFGSPLERALVFLALLRQAQIDGCLLVVPEAEPQSFLVAVLDANEKTPTVYLFDPRLGLPLLGKDGKNLLQLKEALQEPALLRPALLTESQTKKLEAWLVCPLYALSGRMRELQIGLAGFGESSVLYLDGAELARDVGKATALPVKVWNPPLQGKATPNSPTRSLRLFLPVDEGGLDETGQAQKFMYARLPLENAKVNLAQIEVRKRLLPSGAFEVLLGLFLEFGNRYELQVREMHLRGQHESVVRRHERLQLFARNDALVGLAGDAAFAKEVTAWNNKLNDAEAQAAGNGRAALLGLLAQDQFLRSLIDVEKDEKLAMRPEMTVLTRILAVAMRDHFDLELARAQAAANHEKAEHAQALLRARKEPLGPAKAAAHDAWLIARNSWENAYLGRIVLQSLLKRRLKQLQEVDSENRYDQILKQVSLLETLHLDVQNYFHARLCLAACLEHLEGAKAARESLRATRSQIETLEKEGLLLAQINKLNGQPGAREIPGLQERLDLLGHDWSERGNYFWMKRQIDQATGDTAKK